MCVPGFGECLYLSVFSRSSQSIASPDSVIVVSRLVVEDSGGGNDDDDIVVDFKAERKSTKNQRQRRTRSTRRESRSDNEAAKPLFSLFEGLARLRLYSVRSCLRSALKSEALSCFVSRTTCYISLLAHTNVIFPYIAGRPTCQSASNAQWLVRRRLSKR